jgi:AraC-like DNA-binding protein
MAKNFSLTPAYEHVALAPKQFAYLETRQRIEQASDSTLHFHEFAEFIYFKKVNGRVNFNHKSIELANCSMLYLPSNLPHCFQIDDVMELHLFQCSPQFWTSHYPEFNQCFSEEPFYGILNECQWDRFDQLFRWYFEPSCQTNSRLHQDLLKLICWAFYELIDHYSQKNLAPPKDRDQHFFEPFIKTVDQQLNMSLNEASSLCHVTRSHFCRKFKKYFGISFSSYLEKRKVEKAKSLLINTNDSMTDIAHQCGFNDSSYFSSTFKKHNHLSPLKMRKLINSNKPIAKG